MDYFSCEEILQPKISFVDCLARGRRGIFELLFVHLAFVYEEIRVSSGGVFCEIKTLLLRFFGCPQSNSFVDEIEENIGHCKCHYWNDKCSEGLDTEVVKVSFSIKY